MVGAFTVEDVGNGLDFISAHNSTADYFDYSKVQTRVYTEFASPRGAAVAGVSGVGGPAPYDRPFRPSRPIGPTDAAATLPFGVGLSRKLQVIDKWTANNDWGPGRYVYDEVQKKYEGSSKGTFPMPWWQDRPPLELPRYNYAAIDSQALYDEARQRVGMFQKLLYGGG